MKVLVVDDDSNLLSGVVEILNLIGGFDPIPVTTGSLALSLLQSGDIYLVLIDYRLADTDGIAFIEQAQKLNPLIECIMMTGSDDSQVLIQALRAGARDFVKKPFDLKDIETAMNNAVKRLKNIPSLKEEETRQIARAVSICRTDRDAAVKLGISYTTLSRNKKRVLVHSE